MAFREIFATQKLPTPSITSRPSALQAGDQSRQFAIVVRERFIVERIVLDRRNGHRLRRQVDVERHAHALDRIDHVAGA